MIRGFLWSPTVKKYIKSVRQIQSKPKIKVCKWSPNWLWAAGGSGWCCEDKYEKDAKDKYEKDGKDKYRKDAGTNIRLEEVRKWGSAPGQTERGLLATQNSWHPCLNIILLPLYVLTLYLPYIYPYTYPHTFDILGWISPSCLLRTICKLCYLSFQQIICTTSLLADIGR